MKSRILNQPSVLLVALCSLICSSCSNKFSDEERAALSSIKIQPSTIHKTAYQDPRGDAIDTGGANPAAANTGFLGHLISETIEGAISATQNNLYKKKEGANFAKLKSVTPSNLDSVLNKTLTSKMKQNSFFASRIRSQSPNKLVSSVAHYTLTRTGKKDKQLLFSPHVKVFVNIAGPDGKTIGSAGSQYTATSTLQYNTATYIANPSLLKQGYEEAIQEIGSSFAGMLNARTAE